MDFHAAAGATVIQTLSSTLAALKNARDLAKESKDHELKEVIGDAFDSLLDLKERMLALDEENRNLKAKLAQRASITGPVPPSGYIYNKEDVSQDHPLCPRCYQEKGHVYLLTTHYRLGQIRQHCPNCDWSP